MRSAAAIVAALVLLPAVPAEGRPTILDHLRGALDAHGIDLAGEGTLTTLTPDGPATRAVVNAEVLAELARVLDPYGADHTVVPGTWGLGFLPESSAFPSCSPSYLYAFVLGNPEPYWHATRSNMERYRNLLMGGDTGSCGGYWGTFGSWKDVTFDLRGANLYGPACGGATLLVEPAAGAVGPGVRCGWREACFNGDAAISFWGPGFGFHVFLTVGARGGVAMGRFAQDLPGPAEVHDELPCVPFIYAD